MTTHLGVQGAYIGTDGMEVRNTVLKMLKETPGGAAGRELFKFFDGIEHENWRLKAKLGRLSSSGENLTAALRAAEQRAGSLQDELNHILAREKDTVETQTEPLEQRSEQEELLKRKVQDLEELLSAEKEKTATLSKEVDSVRAELRSAAADRQKALSEVQKEFARTQSELEGLREIKRKLEKELEKRGTEARRIKEEYEIALERLRQELQDTREEACRSVEEQKMAAERLRKDLEDEKEKSEKNKENDAMAVEGLRKELGELRYRVAELEQEVELKNRLLSEGENRMEKVSEWKVMVEKLSQELEESRRESSEREEQLRAVQKEVDHERGLSTRLNEQVKELQRQLEEVAEKSSVVEKTKELEEARDEVERLHVEVAGVRRDAEAHEERALRLARENERLETELEALSARVEQGGPVEARPSTEQDAFEEEVPHKPIIAFDEFAYVAEEPDASVFPHSESLETADEATRSSESSGAAGESRGSIYHAISMKRLSRRFSSQDEALRELARAQAQIRNYKHEVERLTAALQYVEETIRKGKGDKLKFMQFIVPRPLGTPDVWLRLYLDARERDERLVESQKKSREEFSEWWFRGHHSSDEDSDGSMSEWIRSAGLSPRLKPSRLRRRLRRDGASFRSRLKSPRRLASPRRLLPPLKLPDASTEWQSSMSVMDSFIVTPMSESGPEKMAKVAER
ncbi:hypothetical protein FOZ60_011185 [Perkinsus olseni]|uniref:Uncharacterized protein n=1 Tax=Perkinsus olseni TaxID=32597 RepID=A0A7J6NF29_PEROL|nr:hypothetical protein FOZ60_011185 [Perkinsus olseni]